MKKRLMCLFILLVLLMCPLARADFGGISGDVGYVSSGYDVDTSYDGDGLSSSGSLISFVLMFIFFGILYLLLHCLGEILRQLRFLVQRIQGREPNELPGKPEGVDVTLLKPTSALEDFDEAKLLHDIPRIYVLLQNAWAAGNLTPIQPLLTVSYYAQMCDKLQEDYLDRKITSHLEDIEVLHVELLGCLPGQWGSSDRLYVSLQTRFVNYLTNEDHFTIRGSRHKKVYMRYEWEMKRHRDGSKVFMPDRSALPDDIDCTWRLSEITGISKRTLKH